MHLSDDDLNKYRKWAQATFFNAPDYKFSEDKNLYLRHISHKNKNNNFYMDEIFRLAKIYNANILNENFEIFNEKIKHKIKHTDVYISFTPEEYKNARKRSEEYERSRGQQGQMER